MICNWYFGMNEPLVCFESQSTIDVVERCQEQLGSHDYLLGNGSSFKFTMGTPTKTNGWIPKMNQNDGLEKETPFKYGNFWYLC